jgi:hypothetical protein
MLGRLCIAGLFLGLCWNGAFASEPIGQAATSKNEVTGKLGDLVRSIGVGDGVSGNEVVRTGLESATLLKFLDSSNLTIGASSTIVLDRFVYNPDRSADNVVFGLTRGALRFVSGQSDPTNFMVKTQVATLGVLGTDFVALCDGSNKCAVVVAKGKVWACPHPELPDPNRKLPVDCTDAYDLDIVHNFTIIGANGENSGAQSLPPSVVAAIIRALVNGKPLTIAGIEAGLFNPGGPAIGPRNNSIEPTKISASPQ